MSQYFHIHPENPQLRLLRQAGSIIREGGVIAYPTDSGYALGCQLENKSAVERVRRIRQLDEKHNFTLVCRDLSEIAVYAKVGNAHYRLLKRLTPGPYTFILPATREVPRRLLHAKRRTIGIRVPQNPITLGLLEELQEPMISTSLILPGEDLPLSDQELIYERLQHVLDLVVDGGFCGFEPTTVVGLTGEEPELIREGKEVPDIF